MYGFNSTTLARIFTLLLAATSTMAFLTVPVNASQVGEIWAVFILGTEDAPKNAYELWNPLADINYDNIIDIEDIRIAAKNFGWTKP